MSINIGDNFSYLGKKFLDSRQSFDTIETMLSCTDVPIGFITFCKEDNKRYEYGQNGWVEYAQGEGSNVDLSGYVTDEELEAKGYLTGIPEEYVTNEELEKDLANKFDDVEVNETESNDNQTALDFYANGEVVKTIYFSGGGGGSTAIPPYISTILPENSILGLGELFNLHLDFSSSVTGRGTAKIFVNDVESISMSIPQGENTIPMADTYFTKGTNRVTVYVIDRTGQMSNSLTFYVRYGSLEITSDFDAYTAYELGAVVRYYFTPTAVDTSLALTMYMKIDGEVKDGVTCSSDTRGYFTFPNNLGVGAHFCQAYVMDSAGSTSNVLSFNFIVLDAVSLVVASDTINPIVEEGEQLSLDYKVYMRGDTSFITKTYIDENLVNTGTCGLDFTYYRTNTLTEGIHTIKIEVYDVTETVSDYIIWTVTVTPSTYVMLQPVKAGSLFIGTAQNMTNSSENKEVWRGIDQDGAIVDGILHNFAFNSESGWVDDELLISGASSVEIPITPLANNARYGFTLDIEFASKMIGADDALVLNLWDDEKDCGIKITTEQVILRSAEGNQADLYFTDSEMTSVIFIIDRNEATAKIYLNGVMCSAFHLSDYSIDGVPYLEDFTVNNTIMLGGSGHARIKNLRVYQVALSTDEILNNFMANEARKSEQKALVEFQKGEHLPTLTVYCDFSGLGKDDKKPCKIVYTSTDEEKYGKSFILNHYESQLQYQGTSSMAYPIKNYRLNLRDEKGKKWYYDFPKGKPECRFTLKADFMSSGHWTNTGLTKWINDNLYNYNAKDEKSMNPKKWYDLQNGGSLDDTRECIYGFPCRLILINDGNTPLNEGQNEPTPGNTKDMGIFNFNHDKDATDTMGFDDDVFPNCASYEVTANSDISAGAFMSFKGVPGNFATGGIFETPIGYVNGAYHTPLFPVEMFDGMTTVHHELWTTYTIGVDANFNDLTNIRGVDPDLSKVIVEGVKYVRFKYYDNPNTTISNVTIKATETLQEIMPNFIADFRVKSESDELDYIKQSFELRFPDEDDVPEGWGFMYAYSSAPCIDAYSSYGGSSKSTPFLSTTYFGTNTFSIKTQPSYKISVFTDYGDMFYAPIPTSITLNEGSSFRIGIPSSVDISSIEYIIINNEYYNVNAIEKDVNAAQIYNDPYMIDVIDTSLGLKALIDWVDTSTDEEFVNEFEEHFNKDYTFRYFLLVITLGMVDNLGKNMMLDTWDNKIFMPRFYDCDTICSYDNSGQLKFDVDIEMTQGYWNTSSSRLWTRIRDLFHDELIAKYNNMRQNGLSYESLMRCFYDEQIAKIPQKYYNMDYDVKYGPFADSYIGMANGDTYEHLKRWLQHRLRFVDTLYDYAPSYNNDVLTIRANTTEPMTLEIETYTPVYQHLSWYNNQMDKKKIDGKTSVSFTGTAMAATDQEVLIYGGSNIKSIKGITSMNPNRMLIGSATKLVTLEAPNCPLLADINANKANLAPHIYLNKVDLSGCPLLGGNLIVNQSPLVREIDIRGTAITGLNLPPSLRNLEVLKLPAAIPSLVLNDAGQLHTLEFEEGVKLQSVSMTNCGALVNTINFNLGDVTSVTLNNSYSIPNELYFSKTTNLSLINMPNLERVIYLPNAEYEVFDKTNVNNASDYKVSVFNSPKCNTFMVTAPYRESCAIKEVVGEHETYPDKSPDEVFIANSIDISDTRFTDVKLLATTDTNVLKLPSTTKNIIVDSAYDLDTEYLTDGDYDTIHTDLYEPYNDDYEDVVQLGNRIPNIIPSASDGSLIFSMYAPSMADEPDSGVWDMDGLDIETIHTFGLNNDIVQDSEGMITMPNRYDDYVYKLDNMSRLPNEVLRYTASAKDVFPTMNVEFQYDSVVAPKDGLYEHIIMAKDPNNLPTQFIFSDVAVRDYFISVDYINTSNCNTMASMFQGCKALTSLDLRGIDTTNVTTMAGMFNGCNVLTSLDLSEFDTTNVTTMNSMFAGCNALTSLDVSGFDTSNVKNMGYMFTGCSKLTSLDLSGFDTSKVTDMTGMFQACNALTSLDVSNFDTSKVTVMAGMFNSCNRLTSLDVSNFVTTKVASMYAMFSNCNALTSLDVSNFVTSNVDNMNSMFNNCNALTSLDLSNFVTSKVTNMGSMFTGCYALTSLDVTGWPNNTYTQTAISSLPVGNDATNDIYATVSFTVPSGWSLINNTSKTMSLRQTDLDNLTDEEIAALVDEGWTIG